MTASAPIAPRLLAWAREHGRHDLPWQQQVSAYRVWVSEIMLQQTQVSTVIPYFERFMKAFPTVERLAAASTDDVLAYWSGLGYYARARNLHKAAQIIRDDHGGELPADREALEALPGIGRSTAAAILALAYQQRHAILDGNVKRVLARYHAVPGWPGETRVARQLWALAEQETPTTDVAAYTQAIMDLGAMVCTRGQPACANCPLTDDCEAFRTGTVAEYPGARPKRNQPQRQAVFGVFYNPRGQLLLAKRPPTGIWGGLWCLPEWPDEPSCNDWLNKQCNQSLANGRWLEGIEHTFTHFRLQLSPLQLEIENADAVQDNDDYGWYSLEQALTLGLPAPIRRLLQQLQNEQQESSNGTHGTLRKTG